MRLYVPSIGRTTDAQQHTLRALRAEGLLPKTTVIAPVEEQAFFRKYGVRVISPEDKGIGGARDYAIRDSLFLDESFPIMLDDDLTFFARRQDDPTKFRDMEPGELHFALSKVRACLLTHHGAVAGLATREGGNRNTRAMLYNTRILRVLGYNAKVLVKHGILFSDIPVMEDFHVALSLLKLGYPNVVVNEWCHNQAGSGLSGGCSTYRTPQVQAQAARILAEKHPGVVDVVEKTTKTAWGGGTRIDVRIQWKKAYESSKRTGVLHQREGEDSPEEGGGAAPSMD